MRDTLLQHINEELPFLKNKKLLIACSGGLDSMVLLSLFHSFAFDIAAAHCNFKLRGDESDEDQLFVAKTLSNYKVPFYIEKFDTKKYAKEHKLSTQIAARELRYQWFNELAEAKKYDYILTAHHADDDLETFLINLSRSSGLRGLTGIPAVNENIVRPLLPFTRNQILQYAKAQQLFWREDSSNSKTDYLRNKLRHDVIPVFKQSVPSSLISNYIQTKQFLSQSQSLVDDYMALIYRLVVQEIPEGYTVSITQLTQQSNIKALLYELFTPFGFRDFKAIVNLLTAETGKQVLSPSHVLIKDRDQLILTEKTKKLPNKVFFIEKYQQKIETPFVLTFIPTEKVGNNDLSTICIDFDLLKFPLQIRKPKETDVFQPLGMQGKKKLSKFFKDEKLSLVAKQQIWVLLSDNKIVWVIGHRLDDRFKVTENTSQILEIKRHKNL